MCLMNLDSLRDRFDAVINYLSNLEQAIAGLDSHLEIAFCILALFIAKTQLPIPMSFLCIISGTVFPLGRALVMNIAFSALFFIVKYYEGMFIGGGWARMIINIRQISFVRKWIEFKGSGNPYILFVTRLIPSIPLGMVSKLYGSMHYDFLYYVLLSLVGLFPRIYVYTSIGTELFNPFSVKFIVLLMVIVAFSSISSMAFNIYYGKKSKQMTQTLLIYSPKEKYKIVL